MTENTPLAALDESDPNQRASKISRIDAMVNARNTARTAAVSIPSGTVSAITRDTPQLYFDSARQVLVDRTSGAVVSAADVKRAAQLNPTTERVYDNGVNIASGLDQLKAEETRLKAQLDAASFNPHTGEKTLQLQGDARRVVERLLAQHQSTMVYQVGVYERLQNQRTAEARAADQAIRDETELEEYIQRSAHNRALELEIEERAKAHLAEKQRKERSRW